MTRCLLLRRTPGTLTPDFGSGQADVDREGRPVRARPQALDPAIQEIGTNNAVRCIAGSWTLLHPQAPDVQQWLVKFQADRWLPELTDKSLCRYAFHSLVPDLIASIQGCVDSHNDAHDHTLGPRPQNPSSPGSPRGRIVPEKLS
ncbi:hypothetical protein MGAST_07380 [Mycobacterium gastri 'Wayne']|uniref:Uncharacterized protein n=1 Tax=Mycobacterium gastri TaxID=1777 RepID=A0A1X1VGH4_MYCGS|nr:hypothetical protein MGAST_07380 [Mycobacterium gastri 'Wayne']ORV68154.1 hypothetical protein AWC07_08925 [Mycobacterium gastri]